MPQINTFLGISNRDLSQKVPDSLPSFLNLALVLHGMQKPLMRGTRERCKAEEKAVSSKGVDWHRRISL